MVEIITFSYEDRICFVVTYILSLIIIVPCLLIYVCLCKWIQTNEINKENKCGIRECNSNDRWFSSLIYLVEYLAMYFFQFSLTLDLNQTWNANIVHRTEVYGISICYDDIL